MKKNFPQDNIFTAVICHDRPGRHIAKVRQENLAAHLAHVEKTIDDILVAGPVFTEDGSAINGSFLIYKTDNRQTAQTMLEADPYFKAGIWQDISFQTFYGAAGSAVGGLAYKD